MDPIITQLGTVTAVGQGYPVKAKSAGAHTLAASVVGVAAVALGGILMGSNDLSTWVPVNVVSASGSGSAAAAVQVNGDYAYWRFDVTALTGSAVSASITTDSGAAFVSSDAVATAVDARIRADNWLTKVVTINTEENTGALGFTFRNRWTLETEFKAVELLFGNKSATPQTIDKIAIAVGGDPANKNGAGLTWVPVLSKGNAALTIPAKTVVNLRDYIGAAVTDTEFIESVARLDGSRRHFLYIACTMSAGGGKAWTIWQTGGATGWEAADWERQICSRYQNGDFITSNQAGFTDNTVRGFTPVLGVRYLPKDGRKAITVMASGDSNTEAVNEDGARRGWLVKAQALVSTPDAPVEVCNLGLSQSKAEEFLPFATQMMPLIRPHVHTFTVFSPNSGPAEVYNLQAMYEGMLALDQSYGVVPLPHDGEPRSTGVNDTAYYNLAQDSKRVAWINSVKKRTRFFVEQYVALSNSTGAPYAFNPTMTVDGLHHGNAGGTVIAGLHASAWQLIRKLGVSTSSGT